MQQKQCALVLGDKSAANARAFAVTLYDCSELDRDGETIDLSTTRARGAIPLQIDHDRSVLATVGTVSGIHAQGSRLRGVMTFAPEGVSDTADQMYRQVSAGLTLTVSISFSGTAKRTPEGHVRWTDVEVYDLSLVSVPSSPGARVDRQALEKWLKGDDDFVLEIVDDVNDARLEITNEFFEALSRRTTTRRHSEPYEPAVFDVSAAEVKRLLREVISEVMQSANVGKVAREVATSTVARLRGRVE